MKKYSEKVKCGEKLEFIVAYIYTILVRRETQVKVK